MVNIGEFRTTVTIAPLERPDNMRELQDVMVDERTIYDWMPRDVLVDLGIAARRVDRFETKDGRIFKREVGFVLVSVGGRRAATVVVFAEPGDRVLIGALSLSGLNLRVDPARKMLVDAGPVLAVVAA